MHILAFHGKLIRDIKQLQMKTIRSKIFVTLSTLLVWYFAYYVFKPWLGAYLKSYSPSDEGLRLVFGHAFIYSFPTALVCGVWWLTLIRVKFLPRPLFLTNLKKSFLISTAAGMILAGVTLVLVPLYMGMKLDFHFNFYSILGNLFSNSWEEIIYRGLLFQVFTFATGTPVIGAVVSSTFFAFTHDQYPIGLQIYVGFVGILFAAVFWKTKNLVAPIWMHNIADWIVDLFL